METSGKNVFLLQEEAEQRNTSKLRRYIGWLQDMLLAQSGLAAYTAITFVNFAVFCGSSWQIFLPNTDPARYQCYALTFWLGSKAINLLPSVQCAFLGQLSLPSFHMLPIEYPPLILLPLSLALLAPIAYYQLAFAMLMSLVSMLVYWLLLRYGPRGSAFIFALYLFVGALATAQTRFDLIPATLTLVYVIAAERKHWAAAYIALAFGVLSKLYPILFLPILFIAEQRDVQRFFTPPSSATLSDLPHYLWQTLQQAPRWKWKNLLLFLGIIASVTGAFSLLNFQEAVLSQFLYFIQRPVQIEATSSTFLYLTANLGYPLQITSSFGSLNIISPFDPLASSVCTLLFCIGSVYIIYTQWHDRIDITQATIALLLVFIATGKVFSPQYLIWLIPLLAYAGASDGFWLLCWGLAASLTTFIYMVLYMQTSDPLQIPFVPGYFQAVTIRNGLIVFLTLAYLFNWFQARQRKVLPPHFTDKETRRLLQP
jgi:hypothetical protein